MYIFNTLSICDLTVAIMFSVGILIRTFGILLYYFLELNGENLFS